MELVNNDPKYWEFIRTLRNMDGVREGFIQQAYITREVHEKHIKKHGHLYYICIEDDVPMGYVGVIENDIRVATHPDHQKKGIGKFMINELVKNNTTARAQIKIENTASVALFEACGFVKKYYILEQKKTGELGAS